MVDRAHPQQPLVRKARRGFTLLEIIVALVALAVLVTVAVPTYQRVTNEAADRSTAETLAALSSEATRASFTNNGRVELTRADVSFAAANLGGDTVYTLSDAGMPSDSATSISVEVLGAALNMALVSPSGRCVALSVVGTSNPTTGVVDEDPCIADEPVVDPGGGVTGGLSSPLVMSLVAPTALATSGSLDAGGWSAVIEGDRVYGIARRTGPGDPEITCALRRDTEAGNAGDECPGYPANFVAGPGGDFTTSYSPDAVVIDGKLWTSAAREAGSNDEVGVYCWDLAAAVPCATAWTPLAANIQIGNHGHAAGAAVAPITGVQRAGTKLFIGTARPAGTRKMWYESAPFVPAVAAQILCYDTATNAACGTTNVAGSTGTLVGWSYSESHNRAPTMVSTITSTGRMFYVIDHGLRQSSEAFWNGSAAVVASQRGNRIVCHDTNTNTACAGWTTPAVQDTAIAGGITAASNLTSRVFENPKLAGSLCVVNNYIRDGGATGRGLSCYTSTGAVIASNNASYPAALSTFMMHTPAFALPSNEAVALANPVMFDGAQVGTRLYNVFQVDQQRIDTTGARLSGAGAYTSVSCFDTATDAACAGFGTAGVAGFGAIPGGRGIAGNIGAFSISSDENGCLWVLGDYGNVVNMDPDTGALGCGRSASVASIPSASLDAACPTGTPDITYTHAAITGTAANPVASATLTVANSSGDIIEDWEQVPFTANALDLSPLPNGIYSFTINSLAGGPWAGTPSVEIHFTLNCT